LNLINIQTCNIY